MFTDNPNLTTYAILAAFETPYVAVIVRSGRGMGAVKRISHVEAKPTRYCLSAGNGICPALSSSAWRFLTRILAPT